MKQLTIQSSKIHANARGVIMNHAMQDLDQVVVQALILNEEATEEGDVRIMEFVAGTFWELWANNIKPSIGQNSNKNISK